MSDIDTRWYCTRCRRPLRNEPKTSRPLDTVTADAEQPPIHDGCGGLVAWSQRDRLADA